MYEYFNTNQNVNEQNFTYLKQESNFQVIFSDDDTSAPFNDSDNFLKNFDTTQIDDAYKVYSLTAKITLSVLVSATSLITVSGNLLVMLSFFLDRQIRNPTNYFILSLSVSDFVIGLVSMPFLTLYLMIGKWPFGQVICNLWLSLDYTVCLTSIYTVLFITIDRFCSVKMPAKYRKWRSPNKIITMVMLTWAVPSCLFFTSIFAWSYGSNIEFDPRNCDVAWSSNKIFSVTLVFSYFWTTLIVIIVLYIFIYQVARNLEKKSREKQRKLSSLVGCSATNTGALVGVVVIPTNNDSKKQNDDDDDDFMESNTQLNVSKKKRLQFIKNSHKTSTMKRNDTKSKKPETLTPSSNTTSTNENLNNHDKNENNNNQINKSENNNQTGGKNNLKSLKKTFGANNYSYASTVSKDDDFSSSYESHSDFDNTKKSSQSKRKSVFDDKNKQQPSKLPQQPVLLKPRPESLAVMTHDQFAEKCTTMTTKQSSANLVNIIKKSSIKKSPSTNDNKPKPNGIPFIDDENDELTYVLTRRQFGDKELKVPIKEEKILIKSPLRTTSLLQKISTPIMNSFSRRNSQKSQNEIMPSKGASKFDLLTNQFTTNEKLDQTNCEEKRKLLNDENEAATESKNDQKELVNSLSVSNQNSLKITPSSTQTVISTPCDSSFNQNGNKGSLEKRTSKGLDATTTSRSIGTATSGLVGNTGVRPMPKRKTKHENRARKALRTITFILGAFIFCFAPWHVVSIYNSFCPNCFDSNLYHHFFYSCYFLCYLNSPINPFMYALANQQFKKTFFRILKGDWRRL